MFFFFFVTADYFYVCRHMNVSTPLSSSFHFDWQLTDIPCIKSSVKELSVLLLVDYWLVTYSIHSISAYECFHYIHFFHSFNITPFFFHTKQLGHQNSFHDASFLFHPGDWAEGCRWPCPVSVTLEKQNPQTPLLNPIRFQRWGRGLDTGTDVRSVCILKSVFGLLKVPFCPAGLSCTTVVTGVGLVPARALGAGPESTGSGQWHMAHQAWSCSLAMQSH